MRKRRRYSGQRSPSYMKGYSERSRKKTGFSFVAAIILIALIIIAAFAYFSMDPDENGDESSKVSSSSTPKPTEKIVEQTPAPTFEVSYTPEPTIDISPTQTPNSNATVSPKPKSTDKPKSTPKPTATPKPKATTAPAPTEIPSDPNGTKYVNKYVDSGIYVRSGAGTENSVVYHVTKDQGQVPLNPTGESQVDSSGHTWYGVTTPDGQTGWVREDVVSKQ